MVVKYINCSQTASPVLLSDRTTWAASQVVAYVSGPVAWMYQAIERQPNFTGKRKECISGLEILFHTDHWSKIWRVEEASQQAQNQKTGNEQRASSGNPVAVWCINLNLTGRPTARMMHIFRLVLSFPFSRYSETPVKRVIFYILASRWLST